MIARAAALADRFSVAADRDRTGCPLDLLDAVFDAGLLVGGARQAASAAG